MKLTGVKRSKITNWRSLVLRILILEIRRKKDEWRILQNTLNPDEDI